MVTINEMFDIPAGTNTGPGEKPMSDGDFMEVLLAVEGDSDNVHEAMLLWVRGDWKLAMGYI